MRESNQSRSTWEAHTLTLIPTSLHWNKISQN